METNSLIVTTEFDVVDANDGETSLREAIAFANDPTAGVLGDGDADNDGSSNDTITFADGFGEAFEFGGSISLYNGELALSSDITISGGVAGYGGYLYRTNISGANDSRVIHITDGTVTLDGLEISGGRTTGGDGGAGILQASGTTLSITNSAIQDNSTGYGAQSGDGGGILSYGDLSIDGSEIRFNSAGSGSGISAHGTLSLANSVVGSNFAEAFGGGLANYGDATVRNVTFQNNYADTGGGVANAVGADVDAVNATFFRNASDLDGGGLLNEGSASLTNATLTDNFAGPRYGAYYGGAQSGYGGGIATSGTLDLVNTLVVGNDAYSGDAEIAGAITSQMGSVIGGNPNEIFATGYFGGIYLENGVVPLWASSANPALDIGTAPPSLVSDATGAPRDVDQAQVDNGGTVDAGAVELQEQLGPLADTLFTFTLVDTQSDTDIADLVDGSVVDPGTGTPANRRSIAVDFVGDGVAGDDDGSLLVELIDQEGIVIASRIENVPPFLLFGDTEGNFFNPTFDVADGEYFIQATAFSGNNGTGVELASELIGFTLRDVVESTLTLDVPEILLEGETGIGMISRTGPTTEELQVTLNSDDVYEIIVPPVVTLGIGENTATFDIQAVQDSIIDGTQAAAIRATAPGIEEVVANITVEDTTLSDRFEVSLVDASTDEVILTDVTSEAIDFTSLGLDPSDATLSLTSSLADFDGSVALSLFDAETGAQLTSRLENIEPYALFGDNEDTFFNGAGLPEANALLAVDVFEEDRGVGLLGSFSVDIDII